MKIISELALQGDYSEPVSAKKLTGSKSQRSITPDAFVQKTYSRIMKCEAKKEAKITQIKKDVYLLANQRSMTKCFKKKSIIDWSNKN